MFVIWLELQPIGRYQFVQRQVLFQNHERFFSPNPWMPLQRFRDWRLASETRAIGHHYKRVIRNREFIDVQK
jgi:hypothetical protein